MITCTRCNNETWASELVTPNGPVMLAGPRDTPPQPIVARVCTACGYVELYGPQPIVDEAVKAEETEARAALNAIPAPTPLSKA
jgi:predicted nucleic-acid-binding Zn-ribbon protein